jgi:hypothetical protein
VDLLQRADERHPVGDAQQHRNYAAFSLSIVHHEKQIFAISARPSTAATHPIDLNPSAHLFVFCIIYIMHNMYTQSSSITTT